MEDQHFDAIINELEPGDALVMNSPCPSSSSPWRSDRIQGRACGLLLLKISKAINGRVLKPARNVKEGGVVSFGDGRLQASP